MYPNFNKKNYNFFQKNKYQGYTKSENGEFLINQRSWFVYNLYKQIQWGTQLQFREFG